MSPPTMSLVDLGKRLLEAARKGQEDEVRSLMANGAPFTTDWLGTSPLHLAAQHGHYSTAEVLLRAGVSRDARTKVDRTPLHMAAAEGHSAIVELLVRSGADINARDMLKMTALHWAAEHGHRMSAELLIKYGGDVHALSKFDKTPYDIANDNCNGSSWRCCRRGCRTSAKTSSGEMEEVIAADSVDSAVQHLVGDGGQRVITIVTDQHGNLQSGNLGQPFFVTMQHGQQMVAVPAGQITEEVVEEELQPPPARKRRVETTASNHTDPNKADQGSREALQQQLQEATRKAQEYRQQLLQKEQEAEEYRVRLEAMAHGQANGTSSQGEGREEEQEEPEEEVETVETVVVLAQEVVEEEEEEVAAEGVRVKEEEEVVEAEPAGEAPPIVAS
ncbi:hypothetical protein COCON_G00126700 [Conger conger]|uniref:GA-binding protein subunit beta-2 n=1 Tax=Conger conger TaxID=82655 RepID=A0A9Q1DD43_CONCO|nr:hypothetical protein COCON_G00126700 [Conger conger]